MLTDTPQDLLELAVIDGVTVARFTRRTILDPAAIEAVGQRLMSLIDETGCRRLALDFAQVESLTSGMIGKFVGLQRAIEKDGGRLVFFGVGPFLQTIFSLCNIPQSIPIHTDEGAAVQALKE
jgi:anti-anti-sigma factor